MWLDIIIIITKHMDVSLNGGTPKSSIFIGFSIIFTIHFGVPLFLETSIFNNWSSIYKSFKQIFKKVCVVTFG